MNTGSRPHSLSDIDAIASDWVVRRDSGLTAAERSEFETWQSADPRHRAALERLGQTWSLLEHPRNAGRGDEMVRALSARAHRRRRRTAAAAVAMVGLLVAGLGWQVTRDEGAASYRGAQLVLPEKRVLPDGGTVELKPGAEISVDYAGAWRRVTLHQGEALFHVAENPARPFVVTAGGVDVRAVGTAFLVAMGGREVDVVVTHGRVAVERAAVTETAAPVATLVDAGNRVTVERVQTVAAAAAVVEISPTEMAERLAWSGPRVEFSDTPLADAVALMNRHSKVRLVIDDPALAKIPVNGVFRVDNTETLVRLLEAGFGVRAERADGIITLRKAR